MLPIALPMMVFVPSQIPDYCSDRADSEAETNTFDSTDHFEKTRRKALSLELITVNLVSEKERALHRSTSGIFQIREGTIGFGAARWKLCRFSSICPECDT